MGGVLISPNIKKISERIDPAGNVINPRTKELIKPVEPEYVAPVTPQVIPPAPVQPVASPVAKEDGMSILQQIEATKQRLQELEELKKLKIAEKKAELELLEQ